MTHTEKRKDAQTTNFSCLGFYCPEILSRDRSQNRYHASTATEAAWTILTYSCFSIQPRMELAFIQRTFMDINSTTFTTLSK